MQCNNCPRYCKSGQYFCGRPEDIKINKYQVHKWEEPCISGSRGSGTIFFSHCNLACVFCQNYKISQNPNGEIISKQALSDICWKLLDMGVHNINFVTPTPYTHLIRPVIKELKEKSFPLPFVWNCGGYESIEAIKSLDGLVDIYLPDFKYAQEELALKYSSAKGYVENILKVIKEMKKQVSNVFDDEGLMRSGLVIRHLVLPSSLDNSKAVLELIKKTLGTDTIVSLMAQFFPAFKASEYSELKKTLDSKDYDEICDYFLELGFEDGYSQGLDSASESYVPEFYP
jgi:putative pyruvate formate lyase activating enzyme